MLYHNESTPHTHTQSSGVLPGRCGDGSVTPFLLFWSARPFSTFLSLRLSLCLCFECFRARISHRCDLGCSRTMSMLRSLVGLTSTMRASRSRGTPRRNPDRQGRGKLTSKQGNHQYYKGKGVRSVGGLNSLGRSHSSSKWPSSSLRWPSSSLRCRYACLFYFPVFMILPSLADTDTARTPS
jgi:hypothetical protein